MINYWLARKFLFALDPERAHNLTIASLAGANRLGLSGLAACRPRAAPVTAMGLEFPNPVGLAAGLDKNGDCIEGLAALGFGFIEIGTVTPKPQPGNPRPRIFRLVREQALINRLGFNNKGVDHLVKQVERARYDGVLGINIGKNKDTPNDKAADDYLHCLRRVYPLAGYVTINISSPNTEGLRELQQDDALTALLDRLMSEREKLTTEHGRRVPLAVKIAPDLEPAQLDALAVTFNQLKPDAVIATNTTLARTGVEKNVKAEETGGLSGAPLLHRSTEILSELRQRLDTRIDMIGVGGILSAADAASKFEAGADLVQIYSGLIYRGPRLVRDAVEGALAACD